ncbi:flagellar basal body-associated protein FliL [Hyphomicrobium sp.]|uniref:flagellar basal body-associated protein FliL n=1 Tax=Hyphomicrobium sp. TaxID=82 RepID=UPI003566B907
MIRTLILAVLTCLSTIGGLYGAMTWKANANASSSQEPQSKLQMMKTRMVSVPLLTDGQVLGYVVMRLQFVADMDLAKLSTVQPDVFVADEAFRLIYEKAPEDMKTGRKQVINELAASVATGANKRMGRDVVKDVMIDSWAYLSKQDMMRKL